MKLVNHEIIGLANNFIRFINDNVLTQMESHAAGKEVQGISCGNTEMHGNLVEERKIQYVFLLKKKIINTFVLEIFVNFQLYP